MSKDLHHNGLYVLLFIRDHPPKKDDFHWALYVHHDTDHGGMKYHVKNQGHGWISDHNMTSGVLKSFLLVGLFQIASIPRGLETYLDQQMRTYDHDLNNLSGINCHTWLLWVLDLLRKPVDGRVILDCGDLQELKDEIKEWGNNHAASADENVQPRPIGYSKPGAIFPNGLRKPVRPFGHILLRRSKVDPA